MSFTLNTKKTTKSNATGERQPSEYDGYWINIGPSTEISKVNDDGTTEVENKFSRLPRGIAVGDLEEHKIYATTNPEWAKEAGLVNQIIGLIKSKCAELDEGEAIPLNLDVMLYRRQEVTEMVVPDEDNSNLSSQLFG